MANIYNQKTNEEIAKETKENNEKKGLIYLPRGHWLEFPDKTRIPGGGFVNPKNLADGTVVTYKAPILNKKFILEAKFKILNGTFEELKDETKQQHNPQFNKTYQPKNINQNVVTQKNRNIENVEMVDVENVNI